MAALSTFVVMGSVSLTASPVSALSGPIDLRGAEVRITGPAVSDEIGRSVAGAGDVNGDGVKDFLIGAPEANGRRGAAFVVFGQSALNTVDLANLGGGGFRIDGVSANDEAGASVAPLGDVNADGLDDVLIGAPGATAASRSGAGIAYVVFGRAGTAAVDLADLGAGGFRVEGAAAGDEVGRAVAVAGDVNGDGRPDLLVGAPGADNNSANLSGSAYVVFGKSSVAAVDLLALGDGGFRIDGAAASDQAGLSVSGLGDVNGDGRADVIVGAPNVNSIAGAVYVVFGKSGPDPVKTATLGLGGYRIDGVAPFDGAGSSLAGVGDVNADGHPDVLIGAPGADNNSLNRSGSAYVAFGKEDTLPVDLAALNGKGFRIDGADTEDGAGFSVAGPGDVNGDGTPDLLVGALEASNNSRARSGSAYVIFGGVAVGVVSLANVAGVGLRIDGANAGDQVGWAVGGPGDINGDGGRDILLGVPSANGNPLANSGAVFAVFGTAPVAPVTSPGPVPPGPSASPPPSTPVTPAQSPQTAVVKVPNRIKAKGKTVVLRRLVTTNAQIRASVRLTWSPRKSAKGASKRFARVVETPRGRVTLLTTGRARVLFVKIEVSAPAQPGFTAFSFTKVWKVR